MDISYPLMGTLHSPHFHVPFANAFANLPADRRQQICQSSSAAPFRRYARARPEELWSRVGQQSPAVKKKQRGRSNWRWLRSTPSNPVVAGKYWPNWVQCLASGLPNSSFSRMRSEGSRFTWGSGGEAAFAKFCVCGRNRSQPFATACVSAVRLSTVASVSGAVPKACQVESLSPQLYWCLQRRCLWEGSASPQLYWCLQKKGLREWFVAPQLYWCWQRRCLWEWSVARQLY